jgi:glucose dehydrogenase
VRAWLTDGSNVHQKSGAGRLALAFYNHDMASTRYSLLTQINAKNVATLKSAWTFR